ncbi:MAG: hypothetical protein EPN82_02420 [Bacteroidetes bacterium]|nr:MAG: hypothetical protein EPN82_02420 [Bacteroidota bacterium]
MKALSRLLITLGTSAILISTIRMIAYIAFHDQIFDFTLIVILICSGFFIIGIILVVIGNYLNKKYEMKSIKGIDPVCHNCSTVHKRTEVIKQIKKQSPHILDRLVWDTKYKCVKCGTEIGISGVRGE